MAIQVKSTVSLEFKVSPSETERFKAGIAMIVQNLTVAELEQFAAALRNPSLKQFALNYLAHGKT